MLKIDVSIHPAAIFGINGYLFIRLRKSQEWLHGDYVGFDPTDPPRLKLRGRSPQIPIALPPPQPFSLFLQNVHSSSCFPATSKVKFTRLVKRTTELLSQLIIVHFRNHR